jgi:hypothetical protein
MLATRAICACHFASLSSNNEMCNSTKTQTFSRTKHSPSWIQIGGGLDARIEVPRTQPCRRHTITYARAATASERFVDAAAANYARILDGEFSGERVYSM